MFRLRRTAAISATLAFAVTGTFLVSPASAATVSCGDTITRSIKLQNDVGPCANGGLIVGASNITVDLAGYRVFGTPSTGDGLGIYLLGLSGVTVRNGTVSDFDAGIVIEGGTANTVTNIRAIDNIGTGATRAGDGISIESSTRNRIVKNTTQNNGPYSGIGLYTQVDSSHPRTTTGVSTGNLIDGNVVVGNIAARSGPVQNTDNIGIRVEPGSSGNTITRNKVDGNGLDGITMFATANDNVVRANTVTGNGFFRVAARRGNGIGLQSIPGVGGADRNVIEGNEVTGNADNGIVARGPRGTTPGASSNVIRGNRAFGNSALPPLPGPFGPSFDLQDANPDCDANVWRGNRHGTANQPCAAG